MKPSTPIDTEMVFLRDMEARLSRAERSMKSAGATAGQEICGMRNVLNARIAEVTKLRDKENDNNAEPKDK